MLKFFDKAFLAKNINKELQDFISPLSELLDFVRDFFK
jgi:type II restriction enzyme